MKQYKKKFKRFTAMLLAILLAGTTTDVSGPAAGVTVYAETGPSQETGAEGTQAASGSALDVGDHVHDEECGCAENTEDSCTCGSEDEFHATNCPAYIAPENPECTCAEKCVEETLNIWCDVCGVQGVSACQGEDTESGAWSEPAYNDGCYEIADASELLWFAEHVNAGNKDANAKLTADIDMSDEAWTPICQTVSYHASETPDDAGYSGIFDGNGYNISNLTVTGISGDTYSYGLFGTVSGTVKNLGMLNYKYTMGSAGDARAGSVAGQVLTDGTITNCYSVGHSITTNSNIAGGIAGCNYGGTISNCYALNGSVSGYQDRWGGVVGDSKKDSTAPDLTQTYGTVSNCYTDDTRVVSSQNDSGSITNCGAVKDDTAFASGEITYLLNGSSSENVIWYQTLETDLETDTYPVLASEHGIVYCGYDKCKAVYANDAGELLEVPLEHSEWADGKCTYCGTACSHNWVDGGCSICGLQGKEVGAFIVTGGTQGTDYSYSGDTLTILTATPLTIRNTAPETPTTDKIKINSGVSADITLAGVNIDVSGQAYTCAFEIAEDSTGAVTITLADDTENILKSGDRCAGLQKNGENGSLVIQGETDGTGSLAATGGEYYGAGIGGGGEDKSTTNITITGGRVTATSGYNAAGIGGGYNGAGTDIAISGGTVIATSGYGGAGIGGGLGPDGHGKRIKISGGTVTATGSNQGAGIGAGNAGEVSDIIICGGSVKAVAGVTPTTGGASPENVYLLTIANPGNAEVLIDGVEYTPKNHTAADVNDTNLYAHVTGKDHTVKIGDATYAYQFDAENNGFYRTDEETALTITGENLTRGTDYSYTNGVLTVKTDKAVRISNTEPATPTTDRIYVESGISANITLAGVNIDTSETGGCAFQIADGSAGAVTITLADGTKNILTSGNYCAGLQKEGENGSLVIQGDTEGPGALVATGGVQGAGIGGRDRGAGTNITISGGVVTATGGNSGAGIGGGAYGAGSNIVITGGSVKAVAGAYADAFGGGFSGGGSVDPTTGGNSPEKVYLLTIANPDNAAVIIDGTEYMPKNHTAADANDTNLYAYVTGEEHSVQVGDVTTQYDFANGVFYDCSQLVKELTVTGDKEALVEGEDYVYRAKGMLVIKTEKAVRIANVTSGTPTTHRIYVESGVSANITLAGVNIDVSGQEDTCAFEIAEDSTGAVTITLADDTENILKSGKNRAGLQKNGENGSLVIQGETEGTGSLTATGGTYGAGIGGDYGAGTNITISGGIVTATGGNDGAGIGGGDGEAGTNITISGGTVTVIGGYRGAGIGGGISGAGTNITISGGTVTAIGGYRGAGIGGGYNGEAGNIIIRGGSLNVVAGTDAPAIGACGTSDFMSSVVDIFTPVTPTTGGASPKDVYLLTVENPDNAVVIIDGAEYTPKNHTAAAARDTNLYLYLTGDRFHAVQVGTGAVAYYMYSETEGGFLVCENLFSYTAPENLVYTGSAIELPENIITTVDGMGTVTVKYYHESSPEVAVAQPVNAGTYTIKIDIAADGTYGSASDFTLAGWTFEVAKADKAPDMPSATMNVAYGVETVGSVTLPTGWIWAAEDASKALIVGEAVSATAVYNGADKGNYETETVEVAITRSACSHTGGTATCKDKAVCGTCGESYGTVDTTNHANTATTLSYDATGHWDDCEGCGTDLNKADHSCTSEVTKQPSVDEEGVRTYTCSTCGYSYTEAIDKLAPTTTPTAAPTSAPSATPTAAPTSAPSATPTAAPTSAPSATPTAAPTSAPSATPTAAPTSAPSATPTVAPTSAPSATPTAAPTSAPSATPTVAPTSAPSATPTVAPTSAPSVTPTVAPTATPTPTPGGSNGGNTGGSGGGGSYYPPHYPSYPTPTPRPTPTVAPTSAPTATPTLVPGIVTVPTSGENVVNEKGEAVTSVIQEPGTTTKLIIPGLTDGKPEEGEEVAPVVWESKNPDVAEVDENGKVTMKSPGLAEITVTVGEGEEAKTETVVVLVEEPRTYVNPLEEAFKDVRLGASWTDIPLTRYQKVGETVDINFYGVKNWKQDNYQYFWRVSDETVARVDSMGHVTALKPGVVELTLALKNKTDGHFLNVQSVKIVIPEDYGNRILLGTSGKDTFDRIVLNLNERIDINFYGVKNWKKEDYEYYWSSSEPSVVWIDKLGRLTPVNPGKADIFLILVEKKTDVPRYVVPVEVTVPEKTEQ